MILLTNETLLILLLQKNHLRFILKLLTISVVVFFSAINPILGEINVLKTVSIMEWSRSKVSECSSYNFYNNCTKEQNPLNIRMSTESCFDIYDSKRKLTNHLKIDLFQKIYIIVNNHAFLTFAITCSNAELIKPKVLRL